VSGHAAPHHRRSRGLTIAPTRAHNKMIPPYQSATNGSELPGIQHEKIAAPEAAAISPAVAPVNAG
jgi:hypothetical protein